MTNDNEKTTLKLSADHPARQPLRPPIIAGPAPVADIDALVLEIYDYIYTGRLRHGQ